MNVIINQLPPDTSEEEIRQILSEHGVPVVSVKLTAEGNPDYQAAVVKLDTDHAGAQGLANALDGRVWRGHRLRARPLVFFTGED